MDAFKFRQSHLRRSSVRNLPSLLATSEIAGLLRCSPQVCFRTRCRGPIFLHICKPTRYIAHHFDWVGEVQAGGEAKELVRRAVDEEPRVAYGSPRYKSLQIERESADSAAFQESCAEMRSVSDSIWPEQTQGEGRSAQRTDCILSQR